MLNALIVCVFLHASRFTMTDVDFQPDSKRALQLCNFATCSYIPIFCRNTYACLYACGVATPFVSGFSHRHALWCARTQRAGKEPEGAAVFSEHAVQAGGAFLLHLPHNRRSPCQPHREDAHVRSERPHLRRGGHSIPWAVTPR
eukprot:1217556-Pyramimonas_sp.AAC.2